MKRSINDRAGPVSPSKFAHVVLKTARYAEMLQWWSTVLQARVVFDNDHLAFLTYDDEHHRVAIARADGLLDRPADACGLEHVAYTYADLGALLHTYARLRDAGIHPYWCVNHGPTTSLYYRDPDANQVELQLDNFPTAEALQAFFRSGAFARNPIGVTFDPERLIARYEDGDPIDVLVQQGAV